MKKSKLLILLSLVVLTTSGCFKRDSMEDIDVYTTAYPIEYVTNALYGDKADVYSVYPDGIILDKYELTEKQQSDYSQGGLFVYNGLSKEKNYAVNMLNENNDLKIIDVSLSMEYAYSDVELWIDPSNLLMVAQNVKNGLIEYITNPYIEEEIEEAYEELKVTLSEIDVELTSLSKSADSNIIVVDNNAFKFLEKYDFEIISLEEEGLTEKTLTDVKKLISSGAIEYIFSFKNTTLSTTVEDLVSETEVEVLEIDPLETITETERDDKIDYVDKMEYNIEQLKKELYQ